MIHRVSTLSARAILLRIPAVFLHEEEVPLEVTDPKERQGAIGTGDEHVPVFAASLQHLLRGHGVPKLRELVVCVDDVRTTS